MEDQELGEFNDHFSSILCKTNCYLAVTEFEDLYWSAVLYNINADKFLGYLDFAQIVQKQEYENDNWIYSGCWRKYRFCVSVIFDDVYPEKRLHA